MAQIYVTDETKKKLDRLAEKDHRAIVDEISFLVDKYEDELRAENAKNTTSKT